MINIHDDIPPVPYCDIASKSVHRGSDSSEADTLAVLNELDLLPDGDDTEDDEYDRMVTIHFPLEAGLEFGTVNITLPIRNVLKWYAEKHSEDAEAQVIMSIRDEFYGGDQEEDYYYMMDPPTTLCSAEDRAVARAARAAGRSGRRAVAWKLNREHKANLESAGARMALREVMWLPFQLERDASDASKREYIAKSVILDEEWDSFVVDREMWGIDREKRERDTRSKLNARQASLLEEAVAWHGRRHALEAIAQQAFNSA